MRWRTSTPRAAETKSASRRRWQRHQRDSEHITVTCPDPALGERGLGEHGVDRGAEVRGPHVLGVAAEHVLAPRHVGVARAWPAEAAKALVPPVADARLRQPFLHGGPGELGIAPAAGRGADVHERGRRPRPRASRRSVPRNRCRARTSAACTDITARMPGGPASGSVTGPERPDGSMDRCQMRQKVELGQVQQTLFFPLLARARETQGKRPLLSDPKAVELVGRDQLRRGHLPDRPEVHRGDPHDDPRLVGPPVPRRPPGRDGGRARHRAEHALRADRQRVGALDRPGPAGHDRAAPAVLRRHRTGGGCSPRRCSTRTGCRRSRNCPGPYFFVSDGVLVYLREEEVTSTLARIAARFPGSSLAFDTYPRAALKWEHKMAARRGIARWQWPCDDPRTLERLGLHLVESASPTRPPAGRPRQPARQVPLPAPARRPGPRPRRHAEPVPRGGRAPAVTLPRLPAPSWCRRRSAGRGSPSCRWPGRAGCAGPRRP